MQTVKASDLKPGDILVTQDKFDGKALTEVVVVNHDTIRYTTECPETHHYVHPDCPHDVLRGTIDPQAAWDALYPEEPEGPDLVVKGVSLNAIKRHLTRYYTERLPRDLVGQERLLRSAQALVEAGFEGFWLSPTGNYNIHLRVSDPGSDLPKLRKALGRVKVTGKSVADPKKRTIDVSVGFDDHPDVTVTYQRVIRRRSKNAPEQKCKLVRKVEARYVLVCEK